MVLQVLADAWQMRHWLYAQRLEAGAVADARALQDRGSADGAGGEDYFAACRGIVAAALNLELDAARLAVFNDHAPDQRVNLHTQIRPAGNRAEERGRGAFTPSLPLVDREIRTTVIVAAVEVVDLGDADCLGRVAEGIEHFPVHSRHIDMPFAARAMYRVGARIVIFGALEDRQDVVPAPSFVAELPPMVVVGSLISGSTNRAAVSEKSRVSLRLLPGSTVSWSSTNCPEASP